MNIFVAHVKDLEIVLYHVYVKNEISVLFTVVISLLFYILVINKLM